MKNKQSNIELLRIVAMVLIIMYHFCVHGVFVYWHSNSNSIEYINNLIVSFGSMFGKVGVDIFILITGYFMIASKFKFFHFLRTYLMTFIYSILILIIAYIYGEHHVPSSILNSSLFPFGGNAYWFVTTYLMLYLLIPFINHFIKTSKKSTLNILMCLLTLLWVIIPSFTRSDYAFSILGWFIYVYFVGALIRKLEFAKIFSNLKFINILALISIIYWISYAFIKCLKPHINLYVMCKPCAMNTLFTLSIALFLFHTFKNLKINCNRFINYISASVLGVYLFHDNDIIRPFLWKKVLNVVSYMNSPYLFLYMILCVILVFIVGVIVDKIVVALFGKVIDFVCLKLSLFDINKRKRLYKKVLRFLRKNNDYEVYDKV